MDKFIFKYLNVFNAIFLLAGLSISIALADNTVWINDSYSYLANYQRVRLIFCMTLIISSLTNFFFVYKATDFFIKNYFSNRVEIFSVRLVQLMFWLSYGSLTFAGIFPWGYQNDLHLFFGVGFFVFQMFAILAFGITFLQRFKKIAFTSIISSSLAILGTIILFTNIEGLLLLETYAVIIFAIWILFINKKILSDKAFSYIEETK